MLDVVLDLSHHNPVYDWSAIKASGISGVIHKATQGATYIDPTYHERRAQALESGLLWGAYHFGELGYPLTQAEHFLSVVQPEPTDLLVLDFEDYIDTTMTLEEAEDFVYHIWATTGRLPGLYSGEAFLTEQLATRTRTLLSGCWLWMACYNPEPPVVPPCWETWSMWQYSCEGTIAGIEGPCDRNKFQGTLAQLYQLWNVPAERP